VRPTEPACPHCGAPLANAGATDVRKIRRAAVAVSLGLAVSVAQLAACDDASGTGGAGGATTASGSSSIAAYGTGSTQPAVGSNSSSSVGSGSSSISAYGTSATVGSSGSGN